MNDFDKQLIARTFSQCAQQYDDSAILQREVGMRMLDRLRFMHIQPNRILDLGSSTGYFSRLLQNQYKEASVYALDIALGMLNASKQIASDLQHQYLICADAERLPFVEQSIDLIFANFTLQWSVNLDDMLQELHRVLRPEGLLMFSTVGPDTLKELRQSWAHVDAHKHVNTFIDMHDLGDALVRAKFSDPVMDVENFCLTYQTVEKLLHDLRQTGSRNVMLDRHAGLTTPRQFKRFIDSYQRWRDEQGRLPLSYEIIYGHAWGTNLSARRQDNRNVHIPLRQLRGRKK